MQYHISVYGICLLGRHTEDRESIQVSGTVLILFLPIALEYVNSRALSKPNNKSKGI